MLKHVVMLRLNDANDSAEGVERLLAMAGRIDTLKDISAGTDIVESPASYHLCLVTTFDDREGLDAYAVHPVHVEVLEWLRPRITERAVCDYLI